ncbi:hypothetical protein STEG23_001697, partial [Scotinomys teguina]
LYIYTMEYYSAEKNNNIMKFADKWKELENIILSEVTQTQKDKHVLGIIPRASYMLFGNAKENIFSASIDSIFLRFSSSLLVQRTGVLYLRRLLLFEVKSVSFLLFSTVTTLFSEHFVLHLPFGFHTFSFSESVTHRDPNRIKSEKEARTSEKSFTHLNFKILSVFYIRVLLAHNGNFLHKTVLTRQELLLRHLWS